MHLNFYIWAGYKLYERIKVILIIKYAPDIKASNIKCNSLILLKVN